MNDETIINLFFQRSENAIVETDKKYHGYCKSIGFHILNNQQDTEECINDCYFAVWNSIPPTFPNNFRVFIGRIMRNLSLDLYRKTNAAKRGNGNFPILLSELDECIPLYASPWETVNAELLTNAIDSFLDTRSEKERAVFIKRYFLCESVGEIATACNLTIINVKVTLHRVRNQLKVFLEKEGFFV